MMRLFILFAVVTLAASCTPAASPNAATTWNYYENDPGGIQVNGPGTHDDILGAQTDTEACASLGDAAFPPGYCEELRRGGSGSSTTPNRGGELGVCESDSAFELLPPGWATPGNPWIRRCP